MVTGTIYRIVPAKSHFLLLLLFFCTSPAVAQLRSAIEVRSLSYEEALEGKPVKLEGVVIFPDPPSTVFIQDGTAGTFFRLGGKAPPRPGTRVSVKGKAFQGLYLPGIEDATFEVLDRPGLPEPTVVTYADLASGRFHYQLVSIEGVIRSISAEDEGTAFARLSVPSAKLEVRVERPAPGGRVLTGSRVRVTALAAGEINNRRQLVKPYLRCASWRSVEILSPPPADSEIASVTLEELLTFQVDERSEQPVKINGVVLARKDAGDITTLFLREGEYAVGVELPLEDAAEVEIGNQIEVSGYAEMARYSARITDGNLTALNRETTDKPRSFELTWKQLESGDWDGNLVSVRGRLANFYETESDTALVIHSLQDPRSSVQVNVPGQMDSLTPGMELQATGICLVESTRHSQYRSMPESVSILARSRNDIVVTRAPAWWTAKRLAGAISILLVVIFLGGLWIYLLRRQVDRQTSALRIRIEHEAAWEERQRIAREFHDTLEQDLTGLSLRLDAASAQIGDDAVSKLVLGCRSLVSRIQSETRNLVSELRESPTKLADPARSLREISSDAPPAGAGPEIKFEITGEMPQLPSRKVHHLKMIAKEAVTNALKHADASRITVSAGCEDGVFQLEIADNGKGFDVDKETLGKSGHFGCMGMRERARKINADLKWKSSPSGSKVTARMNWNHE